ncbi:MAG: hypothetical protein M3461_21900 [Pseudomonadota bacterium]|nr:hypothetical protein [Pseudomonadota bacterium]
MAEELDSVARYAMVLGFAIRPRTVLVEGTTDVELFRLAARLECERTGIDFLAKDLAIVAAGERDRGGVHGVIRELLALRGMARTCLLPNGRPRYRFIGLFDNDKAGQEAVKLARVIDTSILEYKDVFRLWPTMPLAGNLDPGTMQKTFERQNADYKGLKWELEDLLPQQFVAAFLSDYPGAVAHSMSLRGKVHRDFTRDGKAHLHRFVKQHAVRDDLATVVEVLKAIRFYLGLQLPAVR